MGTELQQGGCGQYCQTGQVSPHGSVRLHLSPPILTFAFSSVCQAGALAALWCAFVVLQMLKATVPHCTFAYAGLALVQATILASFTAAFAYSQVRQLLM